MTDLAKQLREDILSGKAVFTFKSDGRDFISDAMDLKDELRSEDDVVSTYRISAGPSGQLRISNGDEPEPENTVLLFLAIYDDHDDSTQLLMPDGKEFPQDLVDVHRDGAFWITSDDIQPEHMDAAVQFALESLDITEPTEALVLRNYERLHLDLYGWELSEDPDWYTIELVPGRPQTQG